MLYVGDGACDERCRKALYLTRQSRLALNQDMRPRAARVPRDGRLLRRRVSSRRTPGPARTAARRRPARRACSRCSRRTPTAPVGSAGRIYLVDPLGNLMMSYPRAAPDKALLTDLKKLLRLSHIG